MNVLVTSKAIWYAMRASGFVSLLLLSSVLMLGIATVKRWRPGGQPRFVTPSLHRSIALLAVVFIALHVVTAVADPYATVGVAAVFVPFAGSFWLGLGALSLDLIAALVLSSLLRQRIAPGVWRAIHWLAYLSWPVAVAHGLGMGSDAGAVWADAFTAACIAAVAASAAWRLANVEHGKHLEPQRAAA